MTSNSAAPTPQLGDPAPPPESAAELAAGWPERHFWRILAAIGLVALACRGVIVAAYLREPLAAAPLNDAKTYWDWAGRIAAGQVIDTVPFFSAPLYPYLLGIVRALHGSLPMVYVLQALADLATAGLLATVARARFGAVTGLISAALFLALQEPASFELRVLAPALHMILTTLAWAALIRVQTKPTIVRLLAAGIVLGLLCLANAPALLLLPLVAVWLFWQSARRRGDFGRAILPVAMAALVIAPATLHNLWASGDVFLIQAVGGITLRLGNHPEANGTLTPLPGISARRDEMHADAARLYQAATGKAPTWSAVDRYFRDQVLAYWRAEPGRAVELAARKLYLLLTSCNYGDIYQPNAEMACGQNRWLRLAPLATPWLLAPALVGLMLWLRHPLRYGPEWMLLAVPQLIVIALFFYSPRYRAPLLPLAALAAAWAIVRALQWRLHKATAVAVVAAFAGGIALGAVNRAIGVDPVDLSTAYFNLAAAHDRAGDTDAAVRTWREGLHLAPNNVAARLNLADVLSTRGRLEEALLEFRSAGVLAPDDIRIRTACGYLLMRLQRWPEARSEFEAVAQATTDPFEANFQLGRINTQMRDLDRAQNAFTRALELHPQSVEAWHDLGVLHANGGRLAEAAECFRRALAINPDDAQCRTALQQVEQLLPR